MSANAAQINQQVLSQSEDTLLEAVDSLKFFLATAPGSFNSSETVSKEESAFNRFALPNGELISCIYYNSLYHITGTDVVRALAFRFLAFGRPIINAKKFEEGIFSDLRNLKSGIDAVLEEPKSDFLEMLFKYNCIRTQKKQKVFFWYSVPHDRLFLDALDRDLKREKLGQETTTQAVAEPALSFTYNPQRSLYDQFCNPATASSYGNDATAAQKQLRRQPAPEPLDNPRKRGREDDDGPSALQRSSSVLGAVNLFEGSPNYKQRRRPSTKGKRKMSDSYTPSPVPEHRRVSIPPGLASAPANLNGHNPFLPSLPPSMFAPPAPSQHRGRLSYSDNYPPPPNVVIPPQLQSIAPGPATMPAMSRHSAHHDVRTFACPLFTCGRLYKHIEDLKKHVRTHTAEKPYACPRCAKRFSRPANMSAHARLHDRILQADTTAAQLELQQEDVEIDEQEATEDAAHQDAMLCMVDSMQDFGVELGDYAPGDERGITPMRTHPPPSSAFPMPSPFQPSSAPLPFAKNGWPSPFAFDGPPSASAPASSMPEQYESPQHMPSPTNFGRSASIAHLPPKSAGPTAADMDRRHRSATPTVGGLRNAFGHPMSMGAPMLQRSATHIGSGMTGVGISSLAATTTPFSAAEQASAVFSQQLDMVNSLGVPSQYDYSASETHPSAGLGFDLGPTSFASRSPFDMLPTSLPSISSLDDFASPAGDYNDNLTTHSQPPFAASSLVANA